MLSACIVDDGIDGVVDEGNDACAVAKEASAAGDLVEDGVEAEAGGGRFDAEGATEAFCCAYESTDCEAYERWGHGRHW